MKLSYKEAYQVALQAFKENRFEDAVKHFSLLAFLLFIDKTATISPEEAMKMTIQSYQKIGGQDFIEQLIRDGQHDVAKQYFHVVRHYLDYREEKRLQVIQEEITRHFPLGVAETRDTVFHEGPGSLEEKKIGTYQAAIVTAQGPREAMEDAHLAIEFEFTVQGKKHQLQLFGLFDGHGGARCGKYVKKYLPKVIQEQIEAYNSLHDQDLYNALIRAFILLNEQWMNLQKRSQLKDFSGTTAIVALFIDDALWVANVGDSRAILSLNGQAIQLSEDAKPTIEKYRDEILFRGGSVKWGRVDGSLDMARSIGDINHPSVSSRPVLKKCDLKRIAQESEDNRLIIACDGLWDVVSSQNAAKIVHNKTLEKAAVTLKNVAFEKGSWDNFTAMVIALPSIQ